jgi:hypothetical protein
LDLRSLADQHAHESGLYARRMAQAQSARDKAEARVAELEAAIRVHRDDYHSVGANPEALWAFLAEEASDDYGSGYVYGSGYGSGSGYGYGAGSGSGDGYGDGYGYGSGYDSGYGYGFGGGSGYGYGFGDGSGDGSGDGYGYGYGSGYDSGDGSGDDEIGRWGDLAVGVPWPGYLRVGCQLHRLRVWRARWQDIAQEAEVAVTEADVAAIEAMLEEASDD